MYGVLVYARGGFFPEFNQVADLIYWLPLKFCSVPVAFGVLVQAAIRVQSLSI